MTKNGGYTIEVDPDKLDELASGIGTAEMKCSFALSKLKWGMGSIAADIAGVGGGNINHLQEKFEGSIKKYKDLLDDSQAFVKKTAADVRQLDQSWQAKLGRTVGEFSGWYDLQRTFGEYDPQTGEKITGGQRAEAGVMTILNFSPGKAIGVFAKGGKMAKTAKIGQEASALGKIKSGRKAVNPAVFKDFFSGAWNSMKGRFRSAKEYIVKGKEAVKRVRENIGNVKVPVGVRVADTGMGARMIVPEKRSLKELGQQFAVKSGGSGTKNTGNSNYDKLKEKLNERYKGFVEKKRQNVPQTSDKYLPTELEHGKFGELPEKPGDNITGHHMPSNKYMNDKYGLKMDESYAINLEQPHPGKGGRHRRTFTYGMGSRTRPEDFNAYMSLNPRDALALDVNDLRRILKEDNLYNEHSREKIKEYLEYYKNYRKNDQDNELKIFEKP